VQTMDEKRLSETGFGAEGFPFRITALDLVQGQRFEWELVDIRILDWR
jgi:hypothetical protein